MRKLFVLLLFLIYLVSLHSKTILYSDSSIHWLGRWNSINDVGKWTAWEGSQLVIKVKGTKSIKINTIIQDFDVNARCAITYSINNKAVKYDYLSQDKEISIGNRQVVVSLPDTILCEIIIHSVSTFTSSFNEKTKVIFNSIEIDSIGKFVTENESKKKLLTVGDSWMGAENDYPRFMNRQKWELYPVSFGGFTTEKMVNNYGFSYYRQPSDEPKVDAAIVGFGVNDYHNNYSLYYYEHYLNLLVLNIRNSNPLAPIYLVQVPDNKDNKYSVYGLVMNKLANRYKNVYFIGTKQIEPALTWADKYHLDLNGRINLAAFVDSSIVDFEIQGEPIPPVYYSKNNITLCDDEVYRFNNKVYTVSGAYSDTLESVDGCDSIVETKLIVYPTRKTSQSISICEGEQYAFNGHSYSKEGNYIDTLKTMHGCDSIVETKLIVYPTSKTSQSVSICAGEEFAFNGNNYSKEGNYIDTLKTMHGCDSIIHTTLIVHPVFTERQYIKQCKSEVFTFNGKEYLNDGLYVDTLRTTNGCDSIIITELEYFDCINKVYPNPLLDNLTVEFVTDLISDVSIEIVDLSGLLKYSTYLRRVDKGINRHNIILNREYVKNGICVLKLGINNVFSYHKIVFQ